MGRAMLAGPLRTSLHQMQLPWGILRRHLMAGPAPGRSACRMGEIDSSTWKQSCVIKPPKMLFWETQKSKARHSGNAVLSHRRQRWQEEIYKFDHSTHFKALYKKRCHKCKAKQWAEIVTYITSPGVTSKILKKKSFMGTSLAQSEDSWSLGLWVWSPHWV